MKIIQQSVELIEESDILRRLELCGRVCYKSEDKISEDSAERFVKAIISRGHTSVLEHAQIKIHHNDFADLYGANADSTVGVLDRISLTEDNCVVINVRDFIALKGSLDVLKTLEHYSDDFITARFICDRGTSHELVRHRMMSFSQESTRYCNYGGKDLLFIEPVYRMGGEAGRSWEYACRISEEAYNTMLQDGAKPQEARAVLNNSLKTEIIVSGKVRWWKHLLNLRLAEDAHPQIRGLMKQFNEKVKLV